MSSWKESMINRLSNLINRNRSAAKISQVLCSSVSIPDICHGRHGRRPCTFFLAGVNFYRFNAKNWQFTV